MAGLPGQSRVRDRDQRQRRNAARLAYQFDFALGDGLVRGSDGRLTIQVQLPLIVDGQGITLQLGAGLAVENGELVVDSDTIEISLGDMDDVDLTGLEDGNALVWNETSGQWEPFDLDEALQDIVDQIPVNLDDLEDVNVPTPNDEEVLMWDADAQEWVSRAIQVVDFDEADFGIFILWSFVPSGAIDGVNDTFSLPGELEEENILVAKNGLVQTPGDDYTVDTEDFNIVFVSGNIPQVGDSLVAMMEQPPNPAELVFNEVPAGDVDGSNDTFTVEHEVVSSRLLLSKNGLVQRPGDDYTFSPSAQEITFLSGSIPQTNDKLLAFYEREPDEENND